VLAAEQASLRRVATLVARGAPPAETFPAIAEEVGSVFDADVTPIARLDPDGLATVVAVAGDPPAALAVGSRWKPEPPLALATVLRTGRSARTDDCGPGSGASGDAIRRMGIRSAVAAPIVVEGQLWGLIAIVSRREPFPGDTEKRMAAFTELLGTAIVSEALTNTAKHAHASCAHVTVEKSDSRLHLSIRDDGVGGADPAGGSGLIGLRDRVHALEGSIVVNSPPGNGTSIVAELPLRPG
jgi:GAF domain-containing protein